MKGYTKIFFLIQLSVIFLLGVESFTMVKRDLLKTALPPLGTTACSQYNHSTISRSDDIFKQGACYVQNMFQGPPTTAPFKCIYINITDGVADPVLGQLYALTVLGLPIPNSVGTSTITTCNLTTNAIKVFNYTYADLGQGQTFTVNVNSTSQSVMSVFPVVTQYGYAVISCAVNASQPVCAFISAAIMCTFDQYANQTVKDELLAPFKIYPLNNAAYMYNVSQSDADCKQFCWPNSTGTL